MRLLQEINQELAIYYENYYRVQLGLADWQFRIQQRIKEERNFAKPNIRRIERWLGINFRNKKVFVVGAGTGAEAIVFHEMGARVYAIEPDRMAFKILALKANYYGLQKSRLRLAFAEEIPFNNNEFDFVYCYTVLEHVKDVGKSIDEMIRVVKPNGFVHIQTPDYRFPYEGHYKMERPAFSSRTRTLFKFALKGKPIKFLRSVNFLDAVKLDRILVTRENIVTIRINPPWLHEWSKNSKGMVRRFREFTRKTGIGRDQFIFLRKVTGEE